MYHMGVMCLPAYQIAEDSRISVGIAVEEGKKIMYCRKEGREL